ncbi:hypothetical protein XENOCAPTIV_023754, partial [Xenoophorus captivus]
RARGYARVWGTESECWVQPATFHSSRRGTPEDLGSPAGFSPFRGGKSAHDNN